jgi:hypothetical protein
MKRYSRITVAYAATGLLGVLGLWQMAVAQTKATSGVPGAGQPPFVNAVDQRNEMIRELAEIRSLIKEQNALLKEFVESQRGGAKTKR